MSVHLGAGTLIENGSGEILLVQEGKEHVKGKWNLPSGGFAKKDEDVEETIREAALRETLEETGLKVELKGLIGIYTRDAERSDKKNTLVIFEAEKVEGKLEPNMDEEILDAKYFSPEEIKSMEIRFDLTNIINDFQQKGTHNTPVRPLEF
jgi:8-oxo-dGTP diphosphatase